MKETYLVMIVNGNNYLVVGAISMLDAHLAVLKKYGTTTDVHKKFKIGEVKDGDTLPSAIFINADKL